MERIVEGQKERGKRGRGEGRRREGSEGDKVRRRAN